MHPRHPRPRGFTLIELVIVVMIIGLLAAMAYPLFSKYQCRSKQTEARVALKQLYVAQDAYRASFDAYITEAMAPDHLYPVLNGFTRYNFVITSATAKEFLARADGVITGELAGDWWTVNQMFELENMTPNHCN